jgi:hypothetical protein
MGLKGNKHYKRGGILTQTKDHKKGVAESSESRSKTNTN